MVSSFYLSLGARFPQWTNSSLNRPERKVTVSWALVKFTGDHAKTVALLHSRLHSVFEAFGRKEVQERNL